MPCRAIRATARQTRSWLIVLAAAGCAGAEVDDSAEAGRKGSGSAAVVVGWNELAYEIAYAEDQFLTFKGQRALAMMNLAMHDALNTIAPKYERYAYRGAARAVDPELAAAQSAHVILRSQYPKAALRLDSALSGQREQTPENAHAAALELGSAVAQAVLSAREGDGWDVAGMYAFTRGAGHYQTTPDWKGFVLKPGFAKARPFAIASPGAFRPAPPPALTDDRYQRAYDEVRAFGAKESAVRTADQTAYAIWWLEFAEGSVSRLARRLVSERAVGLWPAARLLAQLHMAQYDALVATWDAKFEYNHWRPITAIQSAADDGNPATTPDAGWQSLQPAPPFPEYVSAHAADCAASFAVLAAMWGNDTGFSMTTITAPPNMPARSFPSFQAAAEECADSRVRLGWHFRYSTDAGLELGERVGTHVLQTQLRAL